MASSHNQAVKALNKGPGKNRFKYKSFSQHLEDIDINIFRSLDPVKFEPSNGLSSFFHEHLLYWRELNSAADFISLYEELMPFVQTLHQILHGKRDIVAKLLCRIHIQAKLSLEPILSLIAVLSRDLREEFEEFLPQVMETLVNLLRSGGDRDPEIIEQVFRSLSCVMKYMQSILVKDVVTVIRITKKLRYYHKDYVREFMAEAVSFLLRKVSVKQLIKGIRKALLEVVSEPSLERTSACSALLWNILKGPAEKFHSRAEQVLGILLDKSTYYIGAKKPQIEAESKPSSKSISTCSTLLENILKGPVVKSHSRTEQSLKVLLDKYSARIGDGAVTDVVIMTFQRLCHELKKEELELLWKCLLEEISSLLPKRNVGGANELIHLEGNIEQEELIHLSHMLSFLNAILKISHGSKVHDYKPFFELADQLLSLRTHLFSTKMPQNDFTKTLVLATYQLLLCLVHNHARVGGASSGPNAILNVHAKWALLFQEKDISLLIFIKDLLEEEMSVIFPFTTYIMSALDYFIEPNPAEVLPLLVKYFEKLDECSQHVGARKNSPNLPNVCKFLLENIEGATEKIRMGYFGRQCASSEAVVAFDPAILWGSLRCFPHISSLRENSIQIWNLAIAIDSALANLPDSFNDMSRKILECTVGVVLTNYVKIFKAETSYLLKHLSDVLKFARSYRKSATILTATSDYLDAVFGLATTLGGCNVEYHSEFKVNRLPDVFGSFSDNLGMQDKRIRLSTLRFLCHFEPIPVLVDGSSERPEKRRKLDHEPSNASESHCKVLHQLLSIEATPISLDTSRKMIGIISRVQMDISVGRIPTTYLIPLMHSLIGALHNRLELLWSPLMECMAVLLEQHKGIVWSIFLQQLEMNQDLFLSQQVSGDAAGTNELGITSVLDECSRDFFNGSTESTVVATTVGLLIRTAHRVPKICASQAHELVPLFFSFLGYSSQDIQSIDKYDQRKCRGKEWKSILKEWLILIKEMGNSRNLLKNNLKEVLVSRLLQDADPDIQYNVFECLLNWKDSFLLPYVEHLKNLISVKTIREEVITWSLSEENQQIEDCHREDLIPFIVHILLPKVKKIKVASARKSAGPLQRKALLRFLAQLEAHELTLFFILLFKSLQNAFHEQYAIICESKHKWEEAMDDCSRWNFLNFISRERIKFLPHKLMSGFLHVMMDVLEIFDGEKLDSFLVPLLSFVLRILEFCASSLEELKDTVLHTTDPDKASSCFSCGTVKEQKFEKASEENTTREDMDLCLEGHLSVRENVVLPGLGAEETRTKYLNQEHDALLDTIPLHVGNLKELRSLCLKIVSIVVNKYDTFDYGLDFWDLFFRTIKPLIDNFTKESGSSEVPSTLFAIILSLSKSVTLAPYLLREKTLVPSIVSILSLKNVSEASISAVLSFIENILDLDDGVEQNSNILPSYEFLSPHLDIIFNSMRNLVMHWRNKKRKGVKGFGKREIKIFKMLGKYVTDPVVVDQFVDCLLIFLDAKKERNQEICIGVLHVIKAMLPALETDSAIKLLKTFSSLLTYASLDIRLIICDILNGLSKVDFCFDLTGKLISDLNAISPSVIGEYDYDRRLSAYEQINSQFFFRLNDQHSMLLLSHCIYDMSAEDLSIRHAASKSLLSFIDFSSSILRGGEKMQYIVNQSTLINEKHRNEDMHVESENVHYNTTNESCWCTLSVRRMVQKFLLSHVKNALAKSENTEISLQREWVLLLRSMVITLPGISILNECKPLSCINDSEVDFFNNIFHIQKHRRAKAVTRFKNVLDTMSLSETTLMQIFVPLFYSLLFENKDAKDGNLANYSIEALACISRHIKWNPYFSLLLRTFRLINKKPEHSKTLVRLICSLLDNFHFAQPVETEANNSASESDGMAADVSKSRNSNKNESIPLEIQECLKTRVLEEINRMIKSQADIVNVSLSRAAIRLLKLLPIETMEVELPSIIQHIANRLKSRMESMRDEARAALVACAKELGPEYLHFIVKTLKITLTRGYELHVLGYSLNFMLLKLSSSLKIGEIDNCVMQMLEIAENDIMGEVSEEKEVEKIASKMKETKSRKSFETLQILAQQITFLTHAGALLVPVLSNLPKSLLPKIKVKIETMLQYLAMGLKSNPSLDQKNLLIFVYGIVKDSIDAEDAARSITKVSANSMTNRDTDNTSDTPNRHLVVVFALQLLENSLKKTSVLEDDGSLMSMLDPFVQLLQTTLSSKYEQVIIGSLKCLSFLVKMPLPSVATKGHDITASIIDMVSRSVKIDTPLMQSATHVLIILLRHTNLSISNSQLRLLLQCHLFIELESSSSSSALSLLKAIVRRKLLVPDLYDLVTRVAHLMVTSQFQVIRQQCSQVLLQFLLDYPLGSKRLQQHLDFLIVNLNYEHASGREAVLEMLHAIILKFPSSVVDEQAETFFLPLVTRLVNDSDSQVRAMVGTVVKVLVGRVSAGIVQRLLEFSVSWYKGENKQLWRPAAQVIGLLIEVIKRRIKPYIEDVRLSALHILRFAVSAVEEGISDANDDESLTCWQEAYYSVIMLEKLFEHLPDISLRQEFEELWDCICRLLVHPHVWLRNSSSRLINIYFKACSGRGTENLAKISNSELFLLWPSRLFFLAASFCHQLDTEFFDDHTCQIVMGNLIHVTSTLHSFVGDSKNVRLHEFFVSLDSDNQSAFLKALSLIGLKSCRRTSTYLLNIQVNSSLSTERSVDIEQELEMVLLEPIFRKLGKVALQVQEVKTKIIFSAYKELCKHMGNAFIQRHAQTILLPLYKFSKGFVGKVMPDELKTVAEEVLNDIKDIVGVESFVQAYNCVRQRVKLTRDKRRQTKKIAAIVNPMRHAKKRKLLAAKRTIQKKRRHLKNRAKK